MGTLSDDYDPSGDEDGDKPRKATWRCPRCQCSENGCDGDNKVEGKDKCMGNGNCLGFICECPEDDWEHPQTPAHGTAKEPCENANCYHCGWGGVYPEKGTKKSLTKKAKSGRKKLRLRVKKLEKQVSDLVKRVNSLEKKLKSRK